jgi:hypothetical protein
VPGEGYFDLGRDLDTLVQTLSTGLAWLKQSTRLHQLDDHWEETGHKSTLLLRGRELKRAEEWLDQRPVSALSPSKAVCELVYESRRRQWRPIFRLKNLLKRDKAPALPERCFISHAYKDARAVEALRSALPSSVEPYIFPEITVSAEERVSDDLVRAILNCPGLIYLEGGDSEQSFWVTFERDFAARNKRKVFSFNWVTGRIRQSKLEPLPIPVYAINSSGDDERVGAIIDFLARERSFDIYGSRQLRADHMESGQYQLPSFNSKIVEKLKSGGCGLLFISANSTGTLFSMEWELLLKAAAAAPERIIPCLLDPAIDEQRLPDSLKRLNFFKLYQSTADGEPTSDADLDMRKVDDLLVRIHHLVYLARNMNADARSPP